MVCFGIVLGFRIVLYKMLVEGLEVVLFFSLVRVEDLLFFEV